MSLDRRISSLNATTESVASSRKRLRRLHEAKSPHLGGDCARRRICAMRRTVTARLARTPKPQKPYTVRRGEKNALSVEARNRHPTAVTAPSRGFVFFFSPPSAPFLSAALREIAQLLRTRSWVRLAAGHGETITAQNTAFQGVKTLTCYSLFRRIKSRKKEGLLTRNWFSNGQ